MVAPVWLLEVAGVRHPSEVRPMSGGHISTQRYQMAQIHPSFRASSMEAAGLRDADDDDYAAYDEVGYRQGCLVANNGAL
eukprot:gene8595-8777_t